MILGLDTSGAVSVALADASGAEILAQRTDTRARHHAEVVIPLIDEVVTAAGYTRQDLTSVVVGRGPGPFTGLRVGLVTARSIAAILGIPVRGVCSLDGLARQVIDRLAPRDGMTIGIATDARRREVYWARYRYEGGYVQRQEGPAVSSPQEAAAALAQCDIVAGRGAAIYPDVLAATPDVRDILDAEAEALIHVASAYAALSMSEELESTDPLYLRQPDAAVPTRRKSALGG
ncbi:tRNA (adenosine(37)-N6)-threonylcarbamoyltransferase complex dimerization subunit type 1 TsaB [Devriesea agamarum]|uniref:tRNA (adenosine(37)-N6)-threonylcarbamoyltransferase complex dimerization subunit type 1 TsaB n=1 Tax=Devriesea agamarum TaxID=472569 RepID=UPI00071CE799|nr:tRNA (adenosine(37)-N6)-threonylcarbamoyltransferase complex dimerization subunit type 1 TsaB [Devriesea agamarum]